LNDLLIEGDPTDSKLLSAVLNSKPVLVVDDNAINRKLLRVVLEAERYRVLECCDGVEALALMEREPVSAIVSDILMPRLDGYQLCHRVRADARWRDLPFIIYSSTFTSPADEKAALEFGADRFVCKPSSSEAILKALEAVLQGVGGRNSSQIAAVEEAAVLKEYNEVLVLKLEERNAELEFAKDCLEQVNDELAERTEQLEQTRVELLQVNKTLELRVQGRTADLEAANEGLEAFSASVSHDLRAPLRYIRGFTTILLEDCAAKLTEPELLFLHKIRDAGQGMEELIDALLILAQVTLTEIRRRPVDLSALAGQVIAELASGESVHKPWVEIASEMSVNADPVLLRVVLTNLLGNAWKYTRNRVDAHIQLSKTECDGNTVYFVRDNGAGFDMSHVNKLFGQFQRLHNKGEFEGIGIGLATVQRIIHRHAGRVWAEAKVNEGATFYFTLPD